MTRRRKRNTKIASRRDKEKEIERRETMTAMRRKSQGELEGGREGGGGGKKGFLFGGSLNPVPSIPSVNSGPISIHSADYIAEYTCFLLLFGLPPSHCLSLSFSLFLSRPRAFSKSASSVSLPRAGCAARRRCPTCFVAACTYIRAMCTT